MNRICSPLSPYRLWHAAVPQNANRQVRRTNQTFCCAYGYAENRNNQNDPSTLKTERKDHIPLSSFFTKYFWLIGSNLALNQELLIMSMQDWCSGACACCFYSDCRADLTLLWLFFACSFPLFCALLAAVVRHWKGNQKYRWQQLQMQFAIAMKRLVRTSCPGLDSRAIQGNVSYVSCLNAGCLQRRNSDFSCFW